MRRIGFDYPNTCPKIDDEIASAKQVIYRFIETLLEEACPLLSTETLHRLADSNTADLYSELEDIFETVRGTNEAMRREADSQITDLQDKLSDLEADLEREA